MAEATFHRMAGIADNQLDSNTIKEAYDSWAETYVKDFDVADYKGPRLGAEKIAQFVTDKQARILDGGCGVGNVGKHLKNLGYNNIHGLDLSPRSLEICKSLNIYQKLINDKLGENRLDMDDDTYDALVTVGTFIPGHVNQSAFKEFVRIVKPGGYIVIGMREEFLDMATEYQNGQLETDMKRFAEEGKWEWTQREQISSFFAGKSGIHFVFKVL